MFIKKLLFAVSILVIIIPAQATDIERPDSLNDVVLLENISLFNEPASSDDNYQATVESTFEKQKNINIYSLKKLLEAKPEFSNFINPTISYLESSENIEDAENHIPELLITLSSEIAKKPLD
jgi:hypothetical protein